MHAESFDDAARRCGWPSMDALLTEARRRRNAGQDFAVELRVPFAALEVHPNNVRLGVGDDDVTPEFVEQCRPGIHTPLWVAPLPDVQQRGEAEFRLGILGGRRRSVALQRLIAEAEDPERFTAELTVPVLWHPAADTASSATRLSLMEDQDGKVRFTPEQHVQALLEYDPNDPGWTQYARTQGLTRDELRRHAGAARKLVDSNADSGRLHSLGLNIEQSAAVAEVESRWKLSLADEEQLAQAATVGGAVFDGTLARVRSRLERADRLFEQERDLKALGLRPLPADVAGWLALSALLSGNGEPLDPEEHAACPGAGYVRTPMSVLPVCAQWRERHVPKDPMAAEQAATSLRQRSLSDVASAWWTERRTQRRAQLLSWATEVKVDGRAGDLAGFVTGLVASPSHALSALLYTGRVNDQIRELLPKRNQATPAHLLRAMLVRYIVAIEELTDLQDQWRVPSPETARYLLAMQRFAGLELDLIERCAAGEVPLDDLDTVLGEVASSHAAPR